ncbi:response regulator transcription factor [Undibacterium sp.]|uniref:response regulator transcription factor n=1 Tax=Undibacterium sp. TaxID=1914977 RepID=UPI002C155374|nr:response regulator transcription factor [Undibacterium sp.]HTD07190.1 response regulator transcription factor [Undibacterium sp.]
MRVLLIEDDRMIGESVEEGLRAENYAVDRVRDGIGASLALANDVYDVVLLDLGLPKKSGLEVLRDYRKQGGLAPVLILTARDTTAERVLGLDIGADDYLIKPFDLDELFARIRAILRRNAGRLQPAITCRGLVLNPASHAATFEGVPLPLSAREFALLQALVDPPGQVISKAQLEEKLYGWSEEVESNTVEVYIHHLRKKLGTDFIKNVRGVGYIVLEQA